MGKYTLEIWIVISIRGGSRLLKSPKPMATKQRSEFQMQHQEQQISVCISAIARKTFTKNIK